MGTGKRVGIGLNASRYQDVYNFSYTNPYYTVDGVSRGFNVFYRATDLSEVNIANYSTNTLGGAVNYGYPIKETARLGFSFGVANTEITTGQYAVQEIMASPRLNEDYDWYQTTRNSDGTYSAIETLNPVSDLPPSYQVAPPAGPGFLDENGDEFLNWTMTGSWSESTLNRGRMATRGASQTFALEVSAPAISDLEFFKVTYDAQVFYPVPFLKTWTLRLRTELGYGDGYGDTTGLPFYENYFAGGFGSVRGYESNTLGPRSTPAEQYSVGQPITEIDSEGNPTQIGGPNGNEFGYIASDGQLLYQQIDNDNDPFGGNILIEGGAELLFPLPFIKDQSQLRTSFFLDAGNVFDTDCGPLQTSCNNLDFGELRYSVGVGLTWVTAFGPMSFSLAKPLNSGEYDEEEIFQFTLGRGF